MTVTAATQAALSVVAVMRLDPTATVAFRDNTSLTGTGYFVASSGGGTPKVQYRLGNSTATYTTTMDWSALANGATHVIVMTKSGDTAALYIDGVQVHTGGSAGSTGVSNPWHVGRNGSVSSFQVATVSEMVFYSRALTQGEVTTLYHAAMASGVLQVTHADMGSADPHAVDVVPQGQAWRVAVASGSNQISSTRVNLSFFDAGLGIKATGADTSMAFALTRPTANRSVDPSLVTTGAYPNSDIQLSGLVEVQAPTTEPPPGPTAPPDTPMPAGDVGWQTLRAEPIVPVRSSFFGATSFWKRALPTTVSGRNAILFQHATQPLANSANWIASLLPQMGLDPATPQSELAPLYGPTHTSGQLGIRREGEPLLIVPADQPLTPIVNQDVTTPTATARWQAVHDALGGLPIPADAMPGATADRFIAVYQPSTNLYAHLYAAGTTDPATVTLSLTGTPTSGSFTLTFDYGDHVTFPNTYNTGPIPFNATAAQVKAAFDNALSLTGSKFPVGSGVTNCLASGGPLNTTPVVLTFFFARPLKPVWTRINSNVLNSGTVDIDHHNAGRINRCRFGSIIVPNGGGTGVSGHFGRSQDRIVGGFYWEDQDWGGSATRIIQFGGLPSYDEVQNAIANNTGLDHAVPMVVAHAQSSPVPFVQPANKGDGDRASNPGYIAEGARIAFPPDVDLSYVEANYPEILWLAKTIRDYGCIVYDKTAIGCEIVFRRASWADNTFNPWFDLLPQYGKLGSTAGHAYMKAMPWHKAQVIDPAFSAP